VDEELFKLPEELPTELNALSELRSEAQAAFDAIKTKVEAGEDLTDEELEHLKYVVDSIAQIDAATAAAEDSKAARNQSIADLIKAGEGEDGEDDERDEGDSPGRTVHRDLPSGVKCALGDGLAREAVWDLIHARGRMSANLS